MHLPDSWGYMVFGGKNPDVSTVHGYNEAGDIEEIQSDALSTPRDSTWPARIAAMNVYYAQKEFSKQNNGSYADTIELLPIENERERKRNTNIALSRLPFRRMTFRPAVQPLQQYSMLTSVFENVGMAVFSDLTPTHLL